MSIDQFDVWTLVQNGYFEKACEKADSEYNQSGDVFPLRNKVYALFHLHKYEECIILTRQIMDLRGAGTDVDIIFCGIAHWLLDKREEAIRLWQKAEQSIYKDAAGGIDIQVFLYFASVKTANSILKKEVVNKLKRLLKSRRSVNWPGPLGRFILGEMTEDALLSCVSNVPILRERHLCQAHFAIAIKKLEQGNDTAYEKELKGSISYGPPSYLEQMYYLAQGELKKI